MGRIETTNLAYSLLCFIYRHLQSDVFWMYCHPGEHEYTYVYVDACMYIGVRSASFCHRKRIERIGANVLKTPLGERRTRTTFGRRWCTGKRQTLIRCGRGSMAGCVDDIVDVDVDGPRYTAYSVAVSASGETGKGKQDDVVDRKTVPSFRRVCVMYLE